MGKWDEAIAAGGKSITLGPNNAMAYGRLGKVLRYAGQFEEAILLLDKSMRLTPYSNLRMRLGWKNKCHFFLGRYDEVVKIAEFLNKTYGDPNGLYDFIINYVGLGQIEKAREYVKKYLKIFPKFNLESHKKGIPNRYPEHTEKQIDALRKAGLPEHQPKPKG